MISYQITLISTVNNCKLDLSVDNYIGIGGVQNNLTPPEVLAITNILLKAGEKVGSLKINFSTAQIMETTK